MKNKKIKIWIGIFCLLAGVMLSADSRSQASLDDRTLPFYMDRYYCGYHFYQAALVKHNDTSIDYTATVTNRSGRKLQKENFWMYFYDKYGNLMFLMRGNVGALKDGETQTVCYQRFNLSAYEMDNIIENTYTYRIYGDGKDTEDIFMNTLALAGSAADLSVRQSTDFEFSAIVSWQKPSDAPVSAVYRSIKKDGPYQLMVSDYKKTTYRDRSVTAGKSYYYCVIPYKKGENTALILENALEKKKNDAVKVRISALKPPTIKITKKRTPADEKYLQITLNKYQGNYAQIYLRTENKFKKVSMPVRSISSTDGKYRLRYKTGGKTLFFKVRTYKKSGKKRKYSCYSKAVKIKI